MRNEASEWLWPNDKKNIYECGSFILLHRGTDNSQIGHNSKTNSFFMNSDACLKADTLASWEY